MKAKEFDLIMNELREVKADIKEVRQTDVPGVHTRIAVLEERMTVLKDDFSKESAFKAKIYGGLGSGIAILMSILVSRFKH